MAYSEVLPDDGPSRRQPLGASRPLLPGHGIIIERVLTDNSPATAAGTSTTPPAWRVTHSFMRAYRTATNGKAERYNRTLQSEWAYARAWHSEASEPGR